jgi:DNA-binding NtrC family response regulator
MEGKNEILKILIIDDDDLVLKSFKIILEKEGYEVFTSASGVEAAGMIKKERYHLILTDLMMEAVDGLTILKEAKKIDPHVVVIIVTGFESMESALESMRKGAYDYLIKPCADIDLKMTVKRGLEKQSLEKKLLELEKLAAITETAVEASNDINTPLNIIIKDLDVLLERSNQFDSETKEGISTLSKEAQRIKNIMEKLTQLSKPVVGEYLGDIKMIDINKSS